MKIVIFYKPSKKNTKKGNCGKRRKAARLNAQAMKIANDEHKKRSKEKRFNCSFQVLKALLPRPTPTEYQPEPDNCCLPNVAIYAVKAK